MREIKCRGKRLDNGKWVHGYYYELKGTVYIIEKGTGFFDIDCGEIIFGTAYCHEVIPGTVGQFTGLHDKKDKEIYTGDILKVETAWYKAEITPNKDEDEADAIFGYRRNGITYWSVEHKIFSSQVGFMIYGIDRRFHKLLTPNMVYNNKAVVVGDIYDNSDLLKEDNHAKKN